MAGAIPHIGLSRVILPLQVSDVVEGSEGDDEERLAIDMRRKALFLRDAVFRLKRVKQCVGHCCH